MDITDLKDLTSVVPNYGVILLSSTELCYLPYVNCPKGYVIIHVIVHRGMLLSICYHPQSYIIVHVIIHEIVHIILSSIYIIHRVILLSMWWYSQTYVIVHRVIVHVVVFLDTIWSGILKHHMRWFSYVPYVVVFSNKWCPRITTHIVFKNSTSYGV